MSRNIYTEFGKYVSLNIFSAIGLSVYIIADSVFIANGVGSHGLAALNIVLPVFSIIFGLAALIGSGGAALFSISRGERDLDKAHSYFKTSIFIGAVIGATATVFGVCFPQFIVGFLGADRELMGLASEYLRVISSFSIAFVLSNILTSFVRNDNNPKLAMAALIISSLSNVVLDYIFIFPLDMGMFGAALATGASPVINIAVLSVHFLRKDRNLRFCGKFNIKKCGRMLKLGVPMLINELSGGVIIFLFNLEIGRIAGNIGIAAYGVIANTAVIATSVFTGIGQGIQPLVSYNYGRGKLDNLRRIYMCGAVVTLAIGALFFTLGLIMPDTIVEAFNSENVAELTSIAVEGIRIYFSAFVLMGINVMTTAFLSAADSPKGSFVISALRGFALIIPLVLILPKLFGLVGVWMVTPLTEAVTFASAMIFCVLFFKRLMHTPADKL